MSPKKQIVQWYQESPGLDVKGIGDAPPIEAYRYHGIKIFFEGFAVETFADFSIVHSQTILGQRGFFDQLQSVDLRRPEEKIIFTPK